MTDKKPGADNGAEWDDAAKAPAPKTVSATPSPDSPVLTKEEIEAIRAQARTEILAEKKKNAKQQFLAMEKTRLLREEGLTTGSTARDQMVRITIDLAEYAPAIVINMRSYWHGQTYTVPRHLAETLREIMNKTYVHENDIEGKSKRSFYQKAHETVLSPVGGVKNAPQVTA